MTLTWNFIWGIFHRKNVREIFLVDAPGMFGGIFVGVNFSPRKCPGEMSGELTGVGVRLPMQDYKSLHVPATILATKVNTQSQTQTQTVTDRQLCSSTFIFLFESQQPLFPPCLTSSLEWTSYRTSPTCRPCCVPVTVISSFSHQDIIITIIIAFTMHHSISVPLQTKTYLFHKSFPP